MVRNIRIKKSRRFKYRNSKRHRNSKRRRNKKTHRGGNNIGGNCNDPSFSIYNTNMLKMFPYKGGNLDMNDPYKNNEGPQF